MKALAKFCLYGLMILIPFFVLSYFWNELAVQMYGTLTIAVYLGILFWAIMGHYISVLISILRRDVKGSANPIDFNEKVFWAGSRDRVLIGMFFVLILSFAFTRFYFEFTGKELNMFYGLLFGFAPDRVLRLMETTLTKKSNELLGEE